MVGQHAAKGFMRPFAISFLVLAMSLTSMPAIAADSQGTYTFAQPPLPLAEALRNYARVANYDVVFPEELVRGRRAPAIVDARSAHEALGQILAGSGLVARFTRPDAFILEARTAATMAPDLVLDRIEIAVDREQREAAYRWYGEKLLNACLSTLRHSRELGLRSYDFTIYLWLSDDGRIEALESAGVGNQAETLAIAQRMLTGLVVGTAPPANMPQPVGLRITAQ
jgi:hypothetical protein